MPGDDNVNEFVGALVLSGDMQSVSYVGQSTTAAGAAAGDVIIHRHSSADPTLALGDATTTIPGASWGGVGKVAKAACSMDGSGYWVVGDPAPVRYVPHGGTQAGVVVNAGFAADGANFNGCQLMAANATAGLQKAMYFEASKVTLGFVFSATNPAEDWAKSLMLPATTAWKMFQYLPYYGKQVISNRARTRYFVNEPYKCVDFLGCTGIWRCDGAPGACGQPAADNLYGIWSVVGIITGGIALSPDDSKLFYTTAQQILDPCHGCLPAGRARGHWPGAADLAGPVPRHLMGAHHANLWHRHQGHMLLAGHARALLRWWRAAAAALPRGPVLKRRRLKLHFVSSWRHLHGSEVCVRLRLHSLRAKFFRCRDEPGHDRRRGMHCQCVPVRVLLGRWGRELYCVRYRFLPRGGQIELCGLPRRHLHIRNQQRVRGRLRDLRAGFRGHYRQPGHDER